MHTACVAPQELLITKRLKFVHRTIKMVNEKTFILHSLWAYLRVVSQVDRASHPV